MKRSIFYKALMGLLLCFMATTSCTKLNQKVYSVVPNTDFWQTPAQIAAGIAPAYQQLPQVFGILNNVMPMLEVSSDEIIVPTRGNDWLDAGHWDALWKHTWAPTGNFLDPAWLDIFNGIGKCNLILQTVKSLNPQPTGVANIIAQLKTVRALYYFYAMDLFGNVPLITDTSAAGAATNTPRATIFNFIESELKSNLSSLSTTVDGTTYGNVTRYFAFSLLARMYLNAPVYTGTIGATVTPGATRWADCIAYCDSLMTGPYSLQPDYYDNFAPTNGPSDKENIFVVPYDKTNINGNSWEMTTLHYQSQPTFGLTSTPYNGFCSTSGFYSNFDTSSTYTVSGAYTLRTFNDARAGQYLIGQQFTKTFNYPPYQNVIVASTDPSIIAKDAQTGLNLIFNPVFTSFSNSTPQGRLVGVRNIKYFPEAGTAGNQSNDGVVFRLGEIYLIKAEAEIRAGTITDALSLINALRERAYGNAAHNWLSANLTVANILAERAREMAWEGVRREDLIRYEILDNIPYFTSARTPDKAADPDKHFMVYPIPQLEIIANGNLHQNAGYN